jgi:hypothetical protein
VPSLPSRSRPALRLRQLAVRATTFTSTCLPSTPSCRRLNGSMSICTSTLKPSRVLKCGIGRMVVVATTIPLLKFPIPRSRSTVKCGIATASKLSGWTFAQKNKPCSKLIFRRNEGAAAWNGSPRPPQRHAFADFNSGVLPRRRRLPAQHCRTGHHQVR